MCILCTTQLHIDIQQCVYIFFELLELIFFFTHLTKTFLNDIIISAFSILIISRPDKRFEHQHTIHFFSPTFRIDNNIILKFSQCIYVIYVLKRFVTFIKKINKTRKNITAATTYNIRFKFLSQYSKNHFQELLYIFNAGLYS